MSSNKPHIVRVRRPINPHSLAYSIDQVADILMVCGKTVRRLIGRGELVHRRIGTKILVPRAAIENFLKKSHPTGNHRK